MKLIQYNNFDIATSTINEGFETKEPYLIIESTDSVPTDYTDVTGDIDAILRFKDVKKIDYLTATILLKTVSDTIGFANLTAEQKAIVAPYLVTDSATLIAYYESLGMDNATATTTYGLSTTEHADANAKACDARWQNKKGASGWFIIALTHFDRDVALNMIDVAEKYMQRYRYYAEFGIGYGDNKVGFLNFINNTGGITESIEDFTLLSGIDYTNVKADLTKFFFI